MQYVQHVFELFQSGQQNDPSLSNITHSMPKQESLSVKIILGSDNSSFQFKYAMEDLINFHVCDHVGYSTLRLMTKLRKFV